MPFRYTKKEGHAVLVASCPPPPPPPDLDAVETKLGLKKSMLRDGNDMLDSDDPFLVVDEEFQGEHRSEIVQYLYEGPPTCQCCVNWVDERPANIYEKDEEKGDDKIPILVRRKRICAGSNVFQIDSIQIQSAPLRLLLTQIFNRYDNIVPFVKYLTFLSPFSPFYWCLEEFEVAMKEEKDEKLAKQLKCLHNIVKSETAGSFSIGRELQDHGIIAYHLLWTLLKPGELLYSKDRGQERFYALHSVSQVSASYSLHVRSFDWNGSYFGFSTSTISVHYFSGSKRITDLNVFPARFLDNLEEVKERLVARGKKFVGLAGIHHKSYREQENVSGNKTGVSTPYLGSRDF